MMNQKATVTWWQQLESFEESTNDQFDLKELFRDSKRIRNIRFWRSVVLLCADVASLVSACFISVYLSKVLRPLFSTNPELSLIPDSRAIQLVMFVLPIVLIIWNSAQANNYRFCKPLWTEAREYLKIILASAAATTVVLFIIDGHFSRILFVCFWLSVLLLLPLSRFLSKKMLMRVDCWYVPAAIFGTGRNARRAYDAILLNRWLGLDVVAFIETAPAPVSRRHVPEELVMRSIKDQRFYELKFGQPHFIFAPESQQEYEESQSILNHVNSISKSVTLLPPFYGLPLGGAEILHVPRCESMFLNLKNNLMKPQNDLMKRMFDLVASTLIILAFSPFLLVISLLVKLDGGPAFFKHKRIGRNGKEFDCIKFRTMAQNSDQLFAEYLDTNPAALTEWKRTQKIKNDPRVTRVGAVLRKYSLDEVPQIFNVFRNEMSLVGPRPIVQSESEKYGLMLPYYMNANPGMTGVWQTSGRSNTSYEERVAMDVWYARNWSFWLDIVIIAKTIPSIVSSEGAY